MSEEMDSIVEYQDDIENAEPPKPLPAGEYVGTIKDAKVKVSEKGNKYYSVTFHIPTDQFPADYDVNENPDGVTLSFNRVLAEDTKAARFRLKNFLTAIGAPMSRQIDCKQWVGQQAKCRLSQDSYEGMPRNQLDAVSAA